jgi:hypothetical protein
LIDVPNRTSLTARRRNPDGNGGRVFGIWTSFLLDPTRPSARVSTKPGRLQRRLWRRCGLFRAGFRRRLLPGSCGATPRRCAW